MTKILCVTRVAPGCFGMTLLGRSPAPFNAQRTSAGVPALNGTCMVVLPAERRRRGMACIVPGWAGGPGSVSSGPTCEGTGSNDSGFITILRPQDAAGALSRAMGTRGAT
jgi:hypothetical protein